MSSQSSPVADHDTLFELLSDSRRRTVLQVLDTRGTPLTVRDLVTTIAARKYEAPLHEILVDVIVDIRISLLHVHIPKLADAGVIEYDPTRERIDDVDREGLQPLLTTMREADDGVLSA